MVFVNVDRDMIARELRAYGEDELANRAWSLDDSDLAQIGSIAGSHAVGESEGTRSGAGMLLAKAVALAAVEVIEGMALTPAQPPPTLMYQRLMSLLHAGMV